MKKHFLLIACVSLFAVSSVFADDNTTDTQGETKECVQNEGTTGCESAVADATTESCSAMN